MTLKVAYIGNFEPPHSTENHVARALEASGVEVVRLQEQRFGWDPRRVPDVAWLMWTHTHGLAPPKTHRAQAKFLESMRRRNIPTVGYHLDRWWDLKREHQIHEEPFFDVDLLCTADGGNQERWASAGVNHHWFPPAVSRPECEPGIYRSELASDVAFVGSWQGTYHPESTHRPELVSWLRDTYGDRCRFWPTPGQHAVRGEALRDLYASVKVLVGDSCFSGDPRGRFYCSDRVPETIGRGGYLVHPETEGLTFEPIRHLATWPAGNWERLAYEIDTAVADDDLRARVTEAGRRHVLAHHTYEVRMRQLMTLLRDREML